MLEYICPVCGKRVEGDGLCQTCINAVAAAQPRGDAKPIATPEHAGQAKITGAGSFREGAPPQNNEVPSIRDNSKLTGVGCALTLLTLAVIFGVAIPIVRWRDPTTQQPLPRFAAIFSPFIIGAVFHGLATLILRIVGLPVWSKAEKDELNRSKV